MTEVSEEALAKMHDDMIDIAAAADFVRGRIRIVGEHFDADFDEEVAMRVVIPRHPSCGPGFAMEKNILPLIAAEIGATRP
ncbi:MAG TPA: hypothetical protein PLR41_11155 [Alphaproteobacteria bacterium]|nr:hypothetical protein [Alphaproteobacteria bacterium]